MSMDTGDRRAPVLIVDDDPVARAVMSAGLAAAGFAPVEAEDGATALARAAERVPALVVADIVMPVMDGLAVCRARRGLPEREHVPILRVTAHESEATLAAAYAAGATDFIAKPVSGFALGVRVRHLLRAAEDARQLRAALDHFRRASAAAEAASRGK